MWDCIMEKKWEEEKKEDGELISRVKKRDIICGWCLYDVGNFIDLLEMGWGSFSRWNISILYCLGICFYVICIRCYEEVLLVYWGICEFF